MTTKMLLLSVIDDETLMTGGPEKEQKFLISQEFKVTFSESIKSNKSPKLLSSKPKLNLLESIISLLIVMRLQFIALKNP